MLIRGYIFFLYQRRKVVSPIRKNRLLPSFNPLPAEIKAPAQALYPFDQMTITTQLVTQIPRALLAKPRIKENCLVKQTRREHQAIPCVFKNQSVGQYL